VDEGKMKIKDKSRKWLWWYLGIDVAMQFLFVRALLAAFALFALGFALSHDVSEDFRGLPRSSLANTAFWCAATGRWGGPIDFVTIPGQSPSQVKEGNHEPKGL